MNPVSTSDGRFDKKNTPSSLVKNISDDPRGSDVHDTPPEDAPERSDRFAYAYLVSVVAVALFVRFFVFAPYLVSGSSMEPNFHDYNYLLVDRLTYRFEEPRRGDVVVLDLPQNTSRALIKRVIGLPGETVVLAGTNPTVSITDVSGKKGFDLTEPYVAPANYGGASGMRITLGPDEYFVLGDNRRVSADSRIWGILPRKDIVGRVLLRLYPFTEIGMLPSQARYSTHPDVSDAL